MSSLKVELYENHRDRVTQLRMRASGLGTVILDEIPYFTPNIVPFAVVQLADMYYYCAPRGSTQSIAMTFSQAVNTSHYLKETN